MRTRRTWRRWCSLPRPNGQRWLGGIGRSDLLRRNGHYEVDLGKQGPAVMAAQARVMAKLGIRTREVSAAELLPLRQAARSDTAAGLWFEDSAHVIDPLEAVRALAAAAQAHGARFLHADVRALLPRGDAIEIQSDQTPMTVAGVVVCAGMGSQPLLAPFGLHAPLQSMRGYHVELPGQAPFLDAPVVYTREHTLVTPMAGRLRASSYMEFADADAPADPRKPARLRRTVRALGYRLRSRRSELGGRTARVAGLLAGNRAGRRTDQTVLRRRAPAHRAHAGAHYAAT